MRDGVFSEESDTYQHDAVFHTNTKELDGAQTNGTMEFDQAQPNVDGCRTLIAHTHLLAREKSF